MLPVRIRHIPMKRLLLGLGLVVVASVLYVTLQGGLYFSSPVMAQMINDHQCAGESLCWLGNRLVSMGLEQAPDAGSDLQPFCNPTLLPQPWSVCIYRWQISDRTGALRSKVNLVTLEVPAQSVRAGDLLAIYGDPRGFNPCWGSVLMPLNELTRLNLYPGADGLPVVLHFNANVSATILSHWGNGEQVYPRPNDPVVAVHYSDTTPYFSQDIDFLAWSGYSAYRHHCSP